MSNEYSDINNYIMKKVIGEGNFGKVKLAEFKPTGEEFAIKILNKKKIKKQMKNVMLRENEIITKLNHINIVFVYKIIETPEDYFIVMEYCKLGELFDYIVKKKKLSEEESSVLFYQLINGVEYMHSRGIAHRDLKPENLLLTEDKVLKIIDFGLSHEFHEDEFLKTKCGSPSYAAPEIIARPNYDGFKIDIWCCGIILYAMLCGYLPFEGDSQSETNNVELFKNILKCEPEIPEFLSDISKDLILEILNPDPKERISIKEIKKHPFYLKGKNLCKIDYSSCEKEIIKTRESFYKNNKEDKEKEKEKEKNKDINDIIKGKKIYFLKNTNIGPKMNNYNNITTDGNIKSTAKNSIELLTNNKYKYTINEDNTYCPTSIENNIDKVTKAKLQLLSLKSKNKQKNEVNSFKKKYNPINLHNYNSKKIGNINNKLQQILNTEANENNKHLGLPFIGLRDAETIVNSLLSTKIKPNLENYNDHSINIKTTEDESSFSKYTKSCNKHRPQIAIKNSVEYKINSCSKSKKQNNIKKYLEPNQYIFENIKIQSENNNLNTDNNQNNNDNILSNIYYNPKSNEKINLNTIRINRNWKNKKIINGLSPGNMVLSLTNENRRRKKYNRYNYDYDYNFKISPNKNLIMKESDNETLNTKSINRNNINKEIKTIFPINIKHSDQNIKTIIKKFSHGDNKNNCKSPEIKSIFNNIKINININSNTVDKTREKKQEFIKIIDANNNNKVKYSYNINIPKNNNEKKLYMLTDANKDINNNEVYKSIAISPNKNYVFNSERSNKRRGVSLPKNNIKNNKYNLTKIIQNVKNGIIKEEKNDIIKKNKSYIDNHSSIDNEGNEIKYNIRESKFINAIRNNTNDKRKNKPDLLRDIIFNNKNNNHNNNKNNFVTLNNLNNHILPKLSEHIYNHQSEKKI